MSLKSAPPDERLALNDPGDETARRYRFQYAWAAITCCAIFDETQGVIEVYCEHHEDVLVKHKDGCFTGHQVKSRESDQPVWKSDDESIVAACSRFVQLEQDFPKHFRAFRLLTNHPLYATKNAKSLDHVLAAILGAPTVADLKSPVKNWLKKIAQRCGATEAQAFLALKKATVSDGLPKLDDAVFRLISTLTTCWSRSSDCSYESVKRAALSLIDECARASGLHHQQLLPAYLIALNQPDADAANRIDGKRMTLGRIQTVLEDALNSVATLAGDPEQLAEPGQGSTDLMFKKLDAGGFSAVSRNSAEDLRDKADHLGIAWTKKSDERRGFKDTSMFALPR